MYIYIYYIIYIYLTITPSNHQPTGWQLAAYGRSEKAPSGESCGCTTCTHNGSASAGAHRTVTEMRILCQALHLGIVRWLGKKPMEYMEYME